MSATRPKRVAICARVSTDQQSTDNQVSALRAVAERHGWDIVAEYVDKGISCLEAAVRRPADGRCETPG